MKHVNYSLYQNTYTLTMSYIIQTIFYEHVRERSQFLFRRGELS